MILMHLLLPWLSQLLLMAVLFAVFSGNLSKQPSLRLTVLVVLLVLGFAVPLAGSTVAQWLRSVLGDLSVITLVVFADILARRLWKRSVLDASTRKALLMVAAATGVVFYPLALGVGPVDPYRVGYAPLMMVCLLGLTSVIAWVRQARSLALILLLPMLAYNLHLLESDNLWNYLLDPVLVIYALVQSTVAVLHGIKSRKNI